MTAARLTVLLALAFACGAASPLAQTPRPQAARDQPREAVGTGSIAGVVVDAAADHHPLRRALVTLHGDALVSPRVVASDDTGRFAFDALPASTYTLSASKAGYVYGNYGAARPGRPGLSMVIADAARRTDVSIALAKGAVITGTVTDERGAPLVDAFITLLRRDVVDGVRRFVDTYQAVFTDARGAYRVYGLAAGDYALLVSRSEVSRRPTDFTPIAEGEIDLALAAARAGTPPPAPQTLPRPLGFAPVYFPAAASLADATPITLQTGEERSGVDVALRLSAVSRVDGTITMPDGAPAANIQVSLLPRGPVSEAAARPYAPGGLLSARRTSAAGTFSFAGVTAGEYEITALAVPSAGRGGLRGGGSPTPPAATLWAMADVALTGDDQTIAMALQPTLTITGRVIFDGTTLAPPNPVDTRVSLLSSEPPAITDLDLRGVSGTVTRDGQLKIAGVLPGSFRLEVTAPGATAKSGWALASATINGRDAFEAPIEIRAGDDLSNAELRFTDTPSQLVGSLQTAAGAPATDYVIVVFSQDRSFWHANSRRAAGARPDTRGAFTFRDLPAGDYYLAAVTDAETGEWFDPAFLESLVPASLKVVIRQGQTTTQNVRASSGS